MFIQTEATPNPEVLKFLPGTMVTGTFRAPHLTPSLAMEPTSGPGPRPPPAAASTKTLMSGSSLSTCFSAARMESAFVIRNSGGRPVSART